MSERESYEHGTFSWVDHVSTDQEAAKNFYATVFGWSYEDRPAGHGVTYSMAFKDGRTVAAIAPQQQSELDIGVPAHWNNYVTVDDVDAIAPRVTELGGTLHMGPFDVLDAGRMAPISDPTGAVLYLWEARQNPGAGLVNTPGSFTWNDLGTRDAEGAMSFYGELFGWTFQPIPESPVPYWVIMNGERSNGGIRRLGDETPAEIPSHWMPYFGVESIDAAIETATAAGGTSLSPKTQAGGDNYFAGLSDASGAVFAIFEGHFDD